MNLSKSILKLNKSGKRLADLIEAYRQDFSKYAKKYRIKYVELIFNEVPRFMSRKFKFSQLPRNWRKRLPYITGIVKLTPALPRWIIFFNNGQKLSQLK